MVWHISLLSSCTLNSLLPIIKMLLSRKDYFQIGCKDLAKDFLAHFAAKFFSNSIRMEENLPVPRKKPMKYYFFQLVYSILQTKVSLSLPHTGATKWISKYNISKIMGHKDKATIEKIMTMARLILLVPIGAPANTYLNVVSNFQIYNIAYKINNTNEGNEVHCDISSQ